MVHLTPQSLASLILSYFWSPTNGSNAIHSVLDSQSWISVQALCPQFSASCISLLLLIQLLRSLLQMVKDFHIPPSQMGNFFLALSLAGILSATPGILILRHFLRLTSIMLLGILAGFVGNSLLGFYRLFGISFNIEFIWTGLIFLGIAFSLLNAPFVP